MSGELIGVLIAVLAVGVTLAGVILTSSRGLQQVGHLTTQYAHITADYKALAKVLSGR